MWGEIYPIPTPHSLDLKHSTLISVSAAGGLLQLHNCTLASDQHCTGSLDASQEAKLPPWRSARSHRFLTQPTALAGVVALQNASVFLIYIVPFTFSLAARADIRHRGNAVGFQRSVQQCRNNTKKKKMGRSRTVNFFVLSEFEATLSVKICHQ